MLLAFLQRRRRVPGGHRCVRGRARVDRRTKNLVGRLRPGEIAVIDHPDIDEVAACALLEKGVKAVLNAGRSVSARYPNSGPQRLLEAGVPLVDDLGPEIFQRIAEGDLVEIDGDRVLRGGVEVARGCRLTPQTVAERMALVRENIGPELGRFLRNTLEYAEREAGFFLQSMALPPLRASAAGRHALVVVRGHHYKKDLRAIRWYIREERPLLIAVDGGADALLEHGFRPDIIVGDMDSVSDRALTCGAELLVHAYPDGRAPGRERVEALGLTAHILPSPGTSEDVAILLAHEMGAALIVAVGAHYSLVDFLDKGRRGMAGTLLVRLRVGSHLVDARGVSLLYRRPLRTRDLWHLTLAAMVPVAAAASLAPTPRSLLYLWWMHLRLLVGL